MKGQTKDNFRYLTAVIFVIAAPILEYAARLIFWLDHATSKEQLPSRRAAMKKSGYSSVSILCRDWFNKASQASKVAAKWQRENIFSKLTEGAKRL